MPNIYSTYVVGLGAGPVAAFWPDHPTLGATGKCQAYLAIQAAQGKRFANKLAPGGQGLRRLPQRSHNIAKIMSERASKDRYMQVRALRCTFGNASRVAAHVEAVAPCSTLLP